MYLFNHIFITASDYNISCFGLESNGVVIFFFEIDLDLWSSFILAPPIPSISNCWSTFFFKFILFIFSLFVIIIYLLFIVINILACNNRNFNSSYQNQNVTRIMWASWGSKEGSFLDSSTVEVMVAGISWIIAAWLLMSSFVFTVFSSVFIPWLSSLCYRTVVSGFKVNTIVNPEWSPF